MVNYSGRTVIATKASSGTESAMAKESDRTRTAAHMSVNTRKISHPAKDCTSGKMARATRVSGRTGYSMGRALRSCPMGLYSTGTGTWAFRKDWVSVSTRMEASTMATGSMGSHMASERRLCLMAPPTKVGGSRERREAMESRFSRMEHYSRVNGKSRSSSKESVSSRTGRSSMVNG